MISLPAVQDIQSYLTDNAWQKSETWRGAAVWSHVDGYQVLVPPRDDLADTDLRVRELLAVLTTVEQRPVDDIVVDICAPLDDVQSFRTFPEGVPSGFTALDAGVSALTGVQAMIGIAARTVAEGPRPEFRDRAPAVVNGLLRRVRLGPARPGSYMFAIRIPVDGPDTPDRQNEPLGRQTARQLHEAVSAVRAATERAERDGLTAFDDTVTAGVSANLCQALSALAGPRQTHAFEIAFRWGRGLPSDLLADTVHFTEGAGRVIHDAARHLKEVRISGPAEVTGFVESLHDQPKTADRWRIKVRGDLITRGRTGYSRTVWIRLGGQDSYNRAIAAHRDGLLVRVRGELSAARGRVELAASGAKFEVIG